MFNPFKNIIHLVKYLKKYGWKKTREEWYYRYSMLDTPEQLIKKEIYGYIGAITGLVLSTIYFLIKGMWTISLAMGGSCWIMQIQMKQKLRQLRALRDIQKQFDEDDKVGDMIDKLEEETEVDKVGI